MSKVLTPREVRALAQLARLSLSDQELSRFVDELNAILTYVEQLADVDTEGLEPTSQVTGLVNVTRPDEVRSLQATPDDLLVQVPHTEGRYIKVRRMI